MSEEFKPKDIVVVNINEGYEDTVRDEIGMITIVKETTCKIIFNNDDLPYDYWKKEMIRKVNA